MALAALQVATNAQPQPLAVLVSAAVLTTLGVLGRDRWLTREVDRREQRMLEEFPSVAELLALALTVGEGTVGALEGVHRLSDERLSRELSGQVPVSGTTMLDVQDGDT